MDEPAAKIVRKIFDLCVAGLGPTQIAKRLKACLLYTSKQYYIDERTGISYTLQGNYYLPNLIPPAEENKPIGIWGQRHLRYIRQHRKVFYTNLLTNGRLNSYLADIDRQAEELFFGL